MRGAAVLGPVFLVAFQATAQAATLPIMPGSYVRDGVACRAAPFAALMEFDGKSFFGPHESDCTTRMLSRPRHNTYRLKTTCRAAGDGTPTASYTEAEMVTVLSATHFIFDHKSGLGQPNRSGFRLCTDSEL